jgi:ACS family hexuronate transporter-like MFS transporter
MSAKKLSEMVRPEKLVLAMLALSTFLNYVDRQTLALLARPLQDALHMDDRAYAAVVICFMVAYALGNLAAGAVVDRIGAARAMPLFVVLWSLAGAICGLVQTVPQLAASRFLLGLFETGNFLAAPVIVSMYLPAHQRASGIGIYSASALLGAAVSPPLVTAINAAMGWRAAFVILGASGFVWTIAWYLLPWSALNTPVSAPDRAKLNPDAIDIPTWRRAVCNPCVWAQAVGTMLTFPVWYFYLNWFPKYLTDERGLTILDMGSRAWVVYLFGGIGSIAVGSLMTFLARKSTLSSIGARLSTMALVCLVAPIGAWNYFSPAVSTSLAIAACVALVHMMWQTIITSMPLEVFTERSLGKVLGVVGIVSGIGGITSTWLIGELVGIVSYRPMFLVMSAAYLVALAGMTLLLRIGGVQWRRLT